MRIYHVLLLFCVPTVVSVCQRGSGTLFILENHHLSVKNIQNCIQECARMECTGVLLQGASCLALNLNDWFGAIEEDTLLRKQCVPGLTSPLSIAVQHRDRLILDHTQRVEKTQGALDCLAACQKQKKFSCKSVTFYEESGDCLMNSANSETVLPTKDTQGFKLSYFEFLQPKIEGDCANSFRLIPYNERLIIGDAQLHNGTLGLDKCLAKCKNCDLVLYNEIFSECFTVFEKEDGQLFDFVNQEYMIFENICKPKTCDMETSIFVANGSYTDSIIANCLKQCISNSKCLFVYLKNRKCKLSAHELSTETPLIEKRCIAMDPIENGVLFKTGKCPERPGIEIVGQTREQCMKLCIEHPTASCDSISYLSSSHLCILHDFPTVGNKQDALGKSANLTVVATNCHHFSLHIIQIEPSNEKILDRNLLDTPKVDKAMKKSSGRTNGKAIVHGLKQSIKRIPVHPNNEPLDLKLETSCLMDRMAVKVKDSKKFSGRVFIRNSFNSCSSIAQKPLQIFFNSTDCLINKSGDVYSVVVVVQRAPEIGPPIITDFDQLFNVSCDYSNHNKTVKTTKNLQLSDSKFHKMQVGGKVPINSNMQMELRSKREEDKKVESVSIGDPLDLVFSTNDVMNDYVIDNCLAISEDAKENITLIIDGCPTKAARSYILRAAPRRVAGGFSIPFRAFRFATGAKVKVICNLEKCAGKCEKPNCSASRGIRRRRTADFTGSEVGVAFLVSDKNDQFCLSWENSAFTLVAVSLIFTIQIIGLLKIRKSQIKNFD